MPLQDQAGVPVWTAWDSRLRLPCQSCGKRLFNTKNVVTWEAQAAVLPDCVVFALTGKICQSSCLGVWEGEHGTFSKQTEKQSCRLLGQQGKGQTAACPSLRIPSTGEEQDLCKAQGGRAAAVTRGICVGLPERIPSPAEGHRAGRQCGGVASSQVLFWFLPNPLRPGITNCHRCQVLIVAGK